MREQDLIDLIDKRVVEAIKNNHISTNHWGNVVSVAADNKKASVTIVGYTTEFTLLNKTGETLYAGDRILIEAISGNLSNGIITVRFE